MKKPFCLSLLVTLLVVFATATFAQDSVSAKDALYKNFTDTYQRAKEIIKGDPKLEKAGNKETYNKYAGEAYQYAKDYLEKHQNEAGKATEFLKKYVGEFEKFKKEERKDQLAQLFDNKKYDEGFALGKEILSDKPDDLWTLYTLARNGLFAVYSGSETNNAATAQYARKAIELIQSGGDLPGSPKDETLAVLNYALGLTILKATPSDALNPLIQVATLPNPAKEDPQVYYLLAVAYEAGKYEKPAQDYQKQCVTPDQIASPTCKAMIEQLNLVVDRVIDAYARAVSLSGSKPNYAAHKAEWMKQLTTYYKYRNAGSEKGLSELIATVLSKPLPTGPI